MPKEKKNKLAKEIQKAKDDKKTTIDEKLLKKAWRITGNRNNITPENKEKLMQILLKVLDQCPYIIFKADLHKLIGMKSSTFYDMLSNSPEYKEEVEWRLARNSALETIRVLEALAKSTHVNALVIRLKMVSTEARQLLNEGYISKDQERKEQLSRDQKLEEIKKLTEELGGDLMRMMKKSKGGNDDTKED